jgi:hypothetical protein
VQIAIAKGKKLYERRGAEEKDFKGCGEGVEGDRLTAMGQKLTWE